MREKAMNERETRQVGNHGVDQVIVKISRAGLLQLLIEDLVPVFLCFKEGVVQFCGEGEAVPGIAINQRFFCRALAGEPVVL